MYVPFGNPSYVFFLTMSPNMPDTQLPVSVRGGEIPPAGEQLIGSRSRTPIGGCGLPAPSIAPPSGKKTQNRGRRYQRFAPKDAPVTKISRLLGLLTLPEIRAVEALCFARIADISKPLAPRFQRTSATLAGLRRFPTAQARREVTMRAPPPKKKVVVQNRNRILKPKQRKRDPILPVPGHVVQEDVLLETKNAFRAAQRDYSKATRPTVLDGPPRVAPSEIAQRLFNAREDFFRAKSGRSFEPLRAPEPVSLPVRSSSKIVQSGSGSDGLLELQSLAVEGSLVDISERDNIPTPPPKRRRGE